MSNNNILVLSLQVCVSSVDPSAFPAAVEAGALMVSPLTHFTIESSSSLIELSYFRFMFKLNIDFVRK